jgi:hypothetical protein
MPAKFDEDGRAKYPCRGISGAGCGRSGHGCSDFRGWAPGVLHL